MRTPSILVGLLGGLAVAVALGFPLYGGLPSRYLFDWPYVSTLGSMWGYVVALLLATATGLGAGALSPEEAVRSGTMAGVVASLTACLLMVLPGSAVEACSDLLDAAQRGTEPADLRVLLAETYLTAAWLPTVSGGVMLTAGPAFGAIGGVLYDLAWGVPTRTTHRDVSWSFVPMVGLVAGIVWLTALTLGLRALTTDVLPRLGVAVTWVQQLQLTSPAAVMILVGGGLLAWVLRDAALMVRDKRRLTGVAWGASGLGLALISALVMGLLYPPTWLSPVTWSAAAVGAVAALVTVVMAPRADEYLSTAPQRFRELAVDALLGSVVVVGPGMLAGGASALALYVVAQPLLEPALGSAAVDPVDAEALVSGVFQLHWAIGGGTLLVALGGLAVSVPFWLFGRAVGRRGR